MPLEMLGPTFETLIHAGLGLRLFQAFARALPCPLEDTNAYYQFFFRFTQNLADNKDREHEPQTKLPPPSPNSLT